MRNLTTVPSLPMVMQRTLRFAKGRRKSETIFAGDARGGRAARKDHFPDYPCNTYGNSPFTTTGNPETINNTRSQTVATR